MLNQCIKYILTILITRKFSLSLTLLQIIGIYMPCLENNSVMNYSDIFNFFMIILVIVSILTIFIKMPFHIILTSKVVNQDIKIDLNDSKVYFKDKQIELTPLEYEILLLFIKNPHRVYTRSQLLEMFWEDRDRFVNDNTLTSTIKRIREKLDKEVISTVRGIGYRMD